MDEVCAKTGILFIAFDYRIHGNGLIARCVCAAHTNRANDTGYGSVKIRCHAQETLLSCSHYRPHEFLETSHFTFVLQTGFRLQMIKCSRAKREVSIIRESKSAKTRTSISNDHDRMTRVFRFKQLDNLGDDNGDFL